MRSLTINVPERVARDLTAPKRMDESPVEARRKDALEEVAELCRVALARPVAPPRQPVTVHALRAMVTDLQGHIGHLVSVHTSRGVVTRVHCEDCDVEIEVES